ncbi:MAG: hypothetical protein GY832_12105 [Chloroflexi bacterium]|nr:hypothetical protein [Chloroflexota bacterium]
MAAHPDATARTGREWLRTVTQQSVPGGNGCVPLQNGPYRAEIIRDQVRMTRNQVPTRVGKSGALQRMGNGTNWNAGCKLFRFPILFSPIRWFPNSV